ncbi:hypothetical protein [Kallotenue papyrolyticum]|uniref:hypothetical protein n=1 Tax=Kallotenue papyrolyticum TaxID=1325125 RepID=UPI00047857B1|nr:hypothetical protein [Kallotenue papyrolyticum]
MTHGQGHYVLGWLIIVVSHNWPVILALIATLWSAIRAWRHPSRRSLAWLYGWALLGVAYEYHKHVAPRLQDAANYLLMFELLPLNRAAWLLAGPIATLLLVISALILLGSAMLMQRAPATSPDRQLQDRAPRHVAE